MNPYHHPPRSAGSSSRAPLQPPSKTAASTALSTAPQPQSSHHPGLSRPTSRSSPMHAGQYQSQPGAGMPPNYTGAVGYNNYGLPTAQDLSTSNFAAGHYSRSTSFPPEHVLSQPSHLSDQAARRYAYRSHDIPSHQPHGASFPMPATGLNVPQRELAPTQSFPRPMSQPGSTYMYNSYPYEWGAGPSTGVTPAPTTVEQPPLQQVKQTEDEEMSNDGSRDDTSSRPASSHRTPMPPYRLAMPKVEPADEDDDDKMDHRKRKRNRTIRSCVPCHNHKRKVNHLLPLL